MATASGGAAGTSAATAALLAAVLATCAAILHGAKPEDNNLRCYWCGPAAEQVHRSPRPPPCGTPLDQHVQACDPGYNFCATVATTPPYTESRVCMKHHKEDCYPRFCNTTKTWKMICTCQGDLCNGDKDQRVIDAFVTLAQRNVTIATTRTPEITSKNIIATTTIAGEKHEFHNAHEMKPLWTHSSESDTVEGLPSPNALKAGGDGGGGEDDEDAGEGSGAPLRSDGTSRSDRTLSEVERTTTIVHPKASTEPPSANGTASSPSMFVISLAMGLVACALT